MPILLVGPREQRADKQDDDVVGGIQRFAGERERQACQNCDADSDEDGFHGGVRDRRVRAPRAVFLDLAAVYTPPAGPLRIPCPLPAVCHPLPSATGRITVRA